MIRTHLYWGYKLSRAEELLKVTAVCPTVCNLSCEREDVRDLGRAVNLIQTRSCCLMCFEQEHFNCHRSIVAHHIVEQTGMRLHHLSIADLISVHERTSYPARPAIA